MTYEELCNAQITKAESEPCHRKRHQAYELALVYARKSTGASEQLRQQLEAKSAEAKTLWMASTEPDARDPELTALMHADHQRQDALKACYALRQLDKKVLAVVLNAYGRDNPEQLVDKAVEEYRVRLLKAIL